MTGFVWLTSDVTSHINNEYSVSSDTLSSLNRLGTKQYEFSDHLGNVLVTILDKRTGTGNAGGNYTGWLTNISAVNDYYPFGMLMEERSAGIGGRYSFNGMEQDNEVKGTGNSLDFGARMYDSRIARWTALDPLQAKYPSLSPYNFVANNPIMFIDPDGKKIVVYHNGKPYQYKPGVKPVPGSPDVLFKVHEAATYSMQTKTGARIWNAVGNSDMIVNIYFKDATLTDRNTNEFIPFDVQGRKDNESKLGDIFWDYNSRFKVEGGWYDIEGKGILSGYISPSTILLHELGHVFLMIEALKKGVKSEEWRMYLNNTHEHLGQDEQYDTKDERINMETNELPYIIEINEIEGENGSYQRPRYNHGGEIEYNNNNADVNLNPSKSEQQKLFNTSY